MNAYAIPFFFGELLFLLSTHFAQADDPLAGGSGSFGFSLPLPFLRPLKLLTSAAILSASEAGISIRP